MKIKKSTVTVLSISEVPHLDPIRVMLDDLGPSQGRLNIGIYGRAWETAWFSMGGKTLTQFILSCDDHYIVKNLAGGISSTKFSGDALHAHAKKTIRSRRKGIGEWQFDRLSDAAAHDLMGRVGALLECGSESAAWSQNLLLTAIYGEDWHQLAEADAPNPEYDYLVRIVEAVRQALKSLQAQPAPKEAP
ncbi:hypothetical protein [Comamonas sp.]|uniref:hypothetical protein n=1 Tax=Comamonas sp. TaxID=34028 RepID=UPI0028A99988|nr:hypothetical protein [Comamonas sp.]